MGALSKVLVFVGRRMEFAVGFIRKKNQVKNILKVKDLHCTTRNRMCYF